MGDRHTDRATSAHPGQWGLRGGTPNPVGAGSEGLVREDEWGRGGLSEGWEQGQGVSLCV